MMQKLEKTKVRFFFVILLVFAWSRAGAADVNAPFLPGAKVRLRGFNLSNKRNFWKRPRPYEEKDFQIIRELGFNFARLPLDYREWIVDGAPEKVDESRFLQIDEAVAWGRKYGVHVCLNIHRAPGFTVARPKEKLSLWMDAVAQRAFVDYWRRFARRYRGIPGNALSFNLLNEPGGVDAAIYLRIMNEAVAAIHVEDPDRPILCDAFDYGRQAVPGLEALNVVQSARGYAPFEVTHYRAEWMRGATTFPEPRWPTAQWNREWMAKQVFAQYVLAKTPVFIGEFGVHRHTPHAVTLRFLEDELSLWKENGWGWALWELRGPFGIIDSDRSDVEYESWHGMKLDRKMLELLQRY